jgi:hypothetical protein
MPGRPVLKLWFFALLVFFATLLVFLVAVKSANAAY